jgi:hypothetical protein
MKNNDFLCIFLDETYLENKSGFVQSAIVLFESDLLAIETKCKEILLCYNKTIKEFKAKNITSKNVYYFREFSKLFINVLPRSENINSIVTIDSTELYKDKNKNFIFIFEIILHLFNEYKVKANIDLAKNLCSQFLWFSNHYPYITKHNIKNKLKIIFDNRNNNAAIYNSTFTLTLEGKTVNWSYEKLFKFIFNNLFELRKDNFIISEIENLYFEYSENNFGVQIADFFSHLVYNAIFHEMGLKTKNSLTKYNLLKEYIPNFPVYNELKKNLSVANNNGIKCDSVDLLSTYILTVYKD